MTTAQTEARAVVRQAANEMLKQNIQWRLDPRYILAVCDEADALAALKKEAADVVRPFADEAKQWDRWTDQEHLVEDWNDGPDSSLTVGHLRAARSFLDKWEGRDV